MNVYKLLSSPSKQKTMDCSRVTITKKLLLTGFFTKLCKLEKTTYMERILLTFGGWVLWVDYVSFVPKSHLFQSRVCSTVAFVPRFPHFYRNYDVIVKQDYNICWCFGWWWGYSPEI